MKNTFEKFLEYERVKNFTFNIDSKVINDAKNSQDSVILGSELIISIEYLINQGNDVRFAWYNDEFYEIGNLEDGSVYAEEVIESDLKSLRLYEVIELFKKNDVTDAERWNIFLDNKDNLNITLSIETFDFWGVDDGFKIYLNAPNLEEKIYFKLDNISLIKELFCYLNIDFKETQS